MRQVKTEGEWSIRETKGDSRTTAGGRPEYEELTEVAAFALGMLGSLYRLDETARSALDQARRGARKPGLQPGSRKPPASRGFPGGARYWDRTSDLFRVREARYRCANRARQGY